MNSNDQAILKFLSSSGESSAKRVSGGTALSYHTVMSLLNGLSEKLLVTLRKESREFAALSEEGKTVVEKGLPEKRLLKALTGKPVALDEALKNSGLSDVEKPIALKWVKQKQLAKIENGQISCLKNDETDVEKVLAVLKRSEQPKASVPQNVLTELMQRRLVNVRGEKEFFAVLTLDGKKALEEDVEVVGQLTPEMLKTGAWKGKRFRAYDANTSIVPVQRGKKHPYGKFIDNIKEKLVGMGFREVNGPLVEMEFWNMDALFMAQDHPAREIHDIFYLDDPVKGELLHHDLVNDVKTAHEKGLVGSKGWRYSWSEETAARLIARSHDTGISARELFKKGGETDKVFFVAHVFRPDEIDWKHFIEFNQLGGYVAGPDINFRELLGYLKTFAVEVFHAEDVKFAPSYFPFTEPSVELYAKIPERGWAEVGGAGMFRPEMLKALNVDVPVMAWGLGIDRLAMLTVGVNDIRELYSQNLKFLRS